MKVNPVTPAPIGMIFHRLTVVGDAEPHIRKCGRKNAKWKCQCSCGNTVEVLADNFKRGRTKSCGCLNLEQARKNLSVGVLLAKLRGQAVAGVIEREKLGRMTWEEFQQLI